jgi:integrase
MALVDYRSDRTLQDAALSARTRDDYTNDLFVYISWARSRGHIIRSLDDLDLSVSAYFNATFRAKAGVGKGAASNVISALKYYLPHAKTAFPHAQQALNGWSRARPKKSYPPLTWSLTVAIAVQMVRTGRSDMGVATLLAFDSLLRVSEFTALQRDDIVFGDRFDSRVDGLYSQSGARIRKAKTGTEQWIQIINNDVLALLRQHAFTRRAGQKLFGFSADQYRSMFKRVCAELGLPLSFVPHSLRHGGGTFLFLMGMPIDNIMIRGRWAEKKSARIYNQSGRALLLSLTIPRTIALAGRLLSKHILLAFAEAQAWARGAHRHDEFV